MKRNIIIVLILLCSCMAFTQVQYPQDTTICNSFMLDYTPPEQIKLVAPDMSFYHVEEDSIWVDSKNYCNMIESYVPYDLFLTQDSREYLVAMLYYGQFRTSYRVFCVGKVDADRMCAIRHPYTNTLLSHFRTENGIHLGMTLDEIRAIRGDNYLCDGLCYTYYWISEHTLKYNPDDRLDYYRRTNTGEMFLKFIIENNQVVWYAIGMEDI